MHSIGYLQRKPRVTSTALVTMLAIAILTTPLRAQQTPQQKRDSVARADSTRKAMPGMPGMKMPKKKTAKERPAKAAPSRRPSATAPMRGTTGADSTAMRNTTAMTMMLPDPLGVPMERMGSGTTWIPDAVSLPSRHFMKGQWDLMLHGFAFAQYDHQSGPRGDDQLGSLNWAMFMASHELASGRFQARTMLSLDPATVTAQGYPLLLQSGESYRGKPLHDRQHPHDFWMELAVLYERPIRDHIGLMLYAAPSGEPALGPVAFMHRPSAMDNPTAPLGHHWQDATHVSFGVFTAGLFTHDWKLEGSIFNGREPDEHRWNFDAIRFDSYSGRLSFNPTRTWALSAGYGYLKSMEALQPDEQTHRVTASAMHGAPIRGNGQWASTLVWGANTHSSNPSLSHSVTLETEAILDRWNTLFGRAEYIQKTAEDLALDEPPSSFPSSREFNIGSVSLGFIRELTRFSGATFGIGAMATLNVVPAALLSSYGSRTPIGSMIFLRLRPFHLHLMEMKPMRGMN